jgi:hypothetical protein
VICAFEATGNYHRPVAWRLAEAGFEVRLVSSLALARTREALHNSRDKNDPKDAQVILHMLKIQATQVYHEPLRAGINDVQELWKTHEAIDRAKTEIQHRILTHYLPPRRPDQEARANSAGDTCRQNGRPPEKPDRFTCELSHRELHIRDSGALNAEMKRQMGRLRKEPCRWPIHATNSSSADDQLKTYVSTWSGFIYVAFVIDAYARRIVGWRASETVNGLYKAEVRRGTWRSFEAVELATLSWVD